MRIEQHELPMTRQSELLDVSRSSHYYKAVPISERDLELMKRIDETHLKYPFYGSRRIKNELRDQWGYDLGRGHVSTLMKRMGIHAIYQKPRLSEKHPGHKIYPYLLRGLDITKANHVWATDITYIPMAKGFCYLIAVIDWATRKVLSWRLSNTLDVSFCVEALEAAIAKYGCPEIFNTDQGSQFTSDTFIDILKANNIQISMDGRGRWMDNVFIERVWRSLKYEEVYLKAYESLVEARRAIGAYFDFYNQKRRHQGLDNQTPDMVYWDQSESKEAA
jgi:putative transposase